MWFQGTGLCHSLAWWGVATSFGASSFFPSGTSSKSFWISCQLLCRSRFCVSSTWTRSTIYPLQISSSSSRSLMKFSTSTACIRGRILPLPPSVSLLLVPLSLQYPCRRHLFYPLRPLPQSPLLGLLVLH